LLKRLTRAVLSEIAERLYQALGRVTDFGLVNGARSPQHFVSLGGKHERLAARVIRIGSCRT